MTPKLVAPSPPPITTPDQALRWAEQVVLDAESARRACDQLVDAAKAGSVLELRRRESVFLIRHGSALGTLTTLQRAGLIGDVAYNAFVVRVRNTILGTVTQVVG